jgi:hypothetical protein
MNFFIAQQNFIKVLVCVCMMSSRLDAMELNTATACVGTAAAVAATTAYLYKNPVLIENAKIFVSHICGDNSHLIEAIKKEVIRTGCRRGEVDRLEYLLGYIDKSEIGYINKFENNSLVRWILDSCDNNLDIIKFFTSEHNAMFIKNDYGIGAMSRKDAYARWYQACHNGNLSDVKFWTRLGCRNEKKLQDCLVEVCIRRKNCFDIAKFLTKRCIDVHTGSRKGTIDWIDPSDKYSKCLMQVMECYGKAEQIVREQHVKELFFADNMVRLAEFFIEKGVDFAGIDLRTALSYALGTDSEMVISFLLSKKVKILPRHIVHAIDVESKSNFFIERCPNLNVQDKDGNTALHHCAGPVEGTFVPWFTPYSDFMDEDFDKNLAKANHKKVVLLLTHGADPEIKNKEGKMPYDLVVTTEAKELLKDRDSVRKVVMPHIHETHFNGMNTVIGLRNRELGGNFKRLEYKK